ncbi:unnamed protein product [Lactuca virosa]|uniref:Uncharacterized protein n=1 Tax=Lactuca virosa TaxID=75947 RepID=A0AAU9LH03_9ASTR|nr:unnamed protein product [Lactuca virosa]
MILGKIGAMCTRFRVYDVDSKLHGQEVKTLKLDEQQFLGEATCTLCEVSFLVISKCVEGGTIVQCRKRVRTCNRFD